MRSFIALELKRIKANILVFICLILIAIAVLWVGDYHKSFAQGCWYLTAMLLCAVVTDAYMYWKPAKTDFPVRNPRKEALYTIICLVIGATGLFFRFMGPVKWDHIQGIFRLMIGLSLILFMFPVAIALGLLSFRYKPKDLGIRLGGLPVAIPIIAIVFITAHFTAPQRFTWAEIYKEEGGVFMTFFSGIVAVGLSEEFMKMAGQTRLGALFSNKGAGWLVITLIWALFHAPKWYGDGGDIKEALIGAVRIVPIGLMWGYITHRTKSILPAVLVHGTNFWGLQNF